MSVMWQDELEDADEQRMMHSEAKRKSKDKNHPSPCLQSHNQEKWATQLSLSIPSRIKREKSSLITELSGLFMRLCFFNCSKDRLLSNKPSS